jgi:hypothetical protein
MRKATTPKKYPAVMITQGIAVRSTTLALMERVRAHLEAKAGVAIARTAIVDMLLKQYIEKEGVK